jgi:hypothetical protein
VLVALLRSPHAYPVLLWTELSTQEGTGIVFPFLFASGDARNSVRPCIVWLTTTAREYVLSSRGEYSVNSMEVLVINRRALSLFVASMCSAFMILGCNAPIDEEAQAGAAEGTLEQGETQAALACDPRAGLHSSMWVTVDSYGQFMYSTQWCIVGRGLPAACYSGRFYYEQQLARMSCIGPVNGSCFDPQSWWLVTCDARIDCTFDCAGTCQPTSC